MGMRRMKFCPKCGSRMKLRQQPRLSFVHWFLRNKRVDPQLKKKWLKKLRDKTKKILFDRSEVERIQNEPFHVTMRRTKEVVYYPLENFLYDFGFSKEDDIKELKEEYAKYRETKNWYWKCRKCSHEEKVERGDSI